MLSQAPKIFREKNASCMLCHHAFNNVYLKSRLSLIVQVNVVLNRTVVVDSD